MSALHVNGQSHNLATSGVPIPVIAGLPSAQFAKPPGGALAGAPAGATSVGASVGTPPAKPVGAPVIPPLESARLGPNLWSLRRLADHLGLTWSDMMTRFYRAHRKAQADNTVAQAFPGGAPDGDTAATSLGCKLVLDRCPIGAAVTEALAYIAREATQEPRGCVAAQSTPIRAATGNRATTGQGDALASVVEKLLARVSELETLVRELHMAGASDRRISPLGITPHPIVERFVERFLVIDPDGVIPGCLLIEVARDWWIRRAPSDRPFHAATFGRYLRATAPTVRVVEDFAKAGEPRRKPTREYAGVRWSKAGERYLERGE